jgi:hypothetical protein
LVRRGRLSSGVCGAILVTCFAWTGLWTYAPTSKFLMDLLHHLRSHIMQRNKNKRALLAWLTGYHLPTLIAGPVRPWRLHERTSARRAPSDHRSW